MFTYWDLNPDVIKMKEELEIICSILTKEHSTLTIGIKDNNYIFADVKTKEVMLVINRKLLKKKME